MSEYNGPATLVTADGKRFDVQVSLTSHAGTSSIPTVDGGSRQLNGPVSWGGQVTGLGRSDLLDLLNSFAPAELHLPNGRVGTFHLTGPDGDIGLIKGTGEAPFD
jgi:hypothetical protein